MRKILIILLLAVAFTLVLLGTASAQEVHEGVLLESNGVSLTVYNQGTALVQDRRTFNLQEGLNVVDFTDVAGMIDSTSVSFKSLADPLGTVVLEQNFVYDLVNSGALLEKYLDEQIEVYLDDGTLVTGQLLSGRGSDIIVRMDSGEVRVMNLADVRNLRFPALPDALITRPTLRWLVRSATTGPQEVELTYLTGGINWRADYSILLGDDEISLDVSGWVTLNNVSGAAFQDAKLKLIAGDVNRVDDGRREDANLAYGATATMLPTDAPQVQQREFFEYQLYEVKRPVTVGDNETKQVEFVNVTGVEATIHYAYDASPNVGGYYYAIDQPIYGDTTLSGVQTWLEFMTGEESGLDSDLPAGRVRVYQKDIDGANLFVREAAIDHTPNGEKVTLFLGNSSDLVGQRKQTDFEINSGGALIFTYHVVTETYEIRLRNHKEDQAVDIRVLEHMFRWSDWEILEASHEYTKLNAVTLEFNENVPPGGEIVITYTVRYRWLG